MWLLKTQRGALRNVREMSFFCRNKQPGCLFADVLARAPRRRFQTDQEQKMEEQQQKMVQQQDSGLSLDFVEAHFHRILDIEKKAEAFRLQEDFQEAEILFETVVDFKIRYNSQIQQAFGQAILKSNDFSLGISLSRYAFCLHNNDRREIAEFFYQMATSELEKERIKFSDDSANQTELLVKLAENQLNHGELLAQLSSEEGNKHFLQQAKEVTQSAYEHLVQLYGEDSEYTGMALSNLSAFAAANQRFEEAEKLGKKAMKLFETRIGTSNPFIRSTARNLLLILVEQEKLEERTRIRNQFEQELPEIAVWEKAARQALSEGRIGLSKEELAKLEQEWEEKPPKKPLDAPGLLRSKLEAAQELQQFMSMRKELFSFNFDSSITQAIERDMASIEDVRPVPVVEASIEPELDVAKEKKRFTIDSEQLKDTPPLKDDELFPEPEILAALADEEKTRVQPLRERYVVRTIKNLDKHKPKKTQPKNTPKPSTQFPSRPEIKK